jgi:hypothetical protein
MITISEIVESMVKQKLFIEEALTDGLINLSSLSRLLKPDIESILKKPVTEASILMALKRLTPHIEMSINRRIEKALKKFGDIIVRSNLTDFTYKNSDKLIEMQSSLLKLLTSEKDTFCTISRGVFETTIVISMHFSDIVKQIFKNEILLSTTNSLSSITIMLPEDNVKLPGLYYYVFKRIAWEGISILEVISTTNEMTIVLKDKDVDKAFSILKRM